MTQTEWLTSGLITFSLFFGVPMLVILVGDIKSRLRPKAKPRPTRIDGDIIHFYYIKDGELYRGERVYQSQKH